jgi:hypothetical protein
MRPGGDGLQQLPPRLHPPDCAGETVHIRGDDARTHHEAVRRAPEAEGAFLRGMGYDATIGGRGRKPWRVRAADEILDGDVRCAECSPARWDYELGPAGWRCKYCEVLTRALDGVIGQPAWLCAAPADRREDRARRDPTVETRNQDPTPATREHFLRVTQLRRRCGRSPTAAAGRRSPTSCGTRPPARARVPTGRIVAAGGVPAGRGVSFTAWRGTTCSRRRPTGSMPRRASGSSCPSLMRRTASSGAILGHPDRRAT